MLIFILSFFFITLFNSASQCYLLYFICILFVVCISSSVDFELSPFLFAVTHCFLSYLCCFLNCICQFAIHIFYLIFVIRQSLESVPDFSLKFADAHSDLINTCHFQNLFVSHDFKVKFDSARYRSIATSYINFVCSDHICKDIDFVSNYEISLFFFLPLGLFQLIYTYADFIKFESILVIL